LSRDSQQPKQGNTGENLDDTRPSFHASADPEKATAAILDEPRPVLRIHESSDSQASSQSSISRLIRNWEQSRVLEVAILRLGCVAFASVGIVLSFYNGEPLNAWTVGISIGTIISIFGTGSRVSLALVLSSCLGQSKRTWFQHDEGSLSVLLSTTRRRRDRQGSLKLLWWAKFQGVLSARRS